MRPHSHRLRTAFLAAWWTAAAPLAAAEIPIATAAGFAAAVLEAGPGDVLILRSGTWADARLAVRCSGSAEQPITIRAERPGTVVFSGSSRLSVAASHVVVEGLWFRDPTGEEAIELRIDTDDSRRAVAHDCRITQCAVTADLPEDGADTSSRFLSIHGSRHRVDHCVFAGKRRAGPTLVVWLEHGVEAGHRIDHNHFGPRPPLDANGGETIRIGDSHTSLVRAGCLVEHNLFERCDGEAECISNKSTGNTYRHNLFRKTSGALTLRHGDDCRVEHNAFLGEGAAGTGGVRIVGSGHAVIANHFAGLRGDDHRSAVCMMLGIPHSPANGYAQVREARIEDNTFFDCEHNVLIGMRGARKATLPPEDCVIARNCIDTRRGPAFDTRCATDGITFADNETGIAPAAAPAPAGPDGPVGPAWPR